MYSWAGEKPTKQNGGFDKMKTNRFRKALDGFGAVRFSGSCKQE
jgi:hypothetical protein